MGNGDTPQPQILQGIMDAVPSLKSDAPDVKIPMRPADQAPDTGASFEQTDFEKRGGTLPAPPIDPIHTMAMAFMGNAAENQKQYEAEAAGQSPDQAAPGSFKSKLAGALNAAGAGLGDAAAAQGGPNDKYSGWLGAVGRVLNARTERLDKTKQQKFENDERLKNDQINTAVANANLRQHALSIQKQEQDIRNSAAASGEEFMSHLRDNYQVTDKVSQDQLKDMVTKDPKFLSTHTARITGYEPVLDADGKQKIVDGKPVETPLWSLANLSPTDAGKQFTVTPTMSKKWSDAGLQNVPAGTVMPASTANRIDMQATRYGTTLSILNHDKVMPLPDEVKDQMVTALQDPEVQHAVAMQPGSPLAGLYEASDNMSQHLTLAQTQLAAAQKAGDQNAVQKLQQDIQSHQEIMQKLDKTIDMGFTPAERSAYQKQVENDRKETETEKKQAEDIEERKRHNLATEAIDRVKANGVGTSPEDLSHAGQMLADSMESPSQLSARAGGKQGKQAVINAADNYTWQTYGKPYNPAQQQIDFSYAQKSQDTLKYMNSLTGGAGAGPNGGNFGKLLQSSDKVNRTEFPPINDKIAWAKLATGDPTIAQYKTDVLDVADQVAKILQGGGSGAGTSDAKLKQAQDLFNAGFTKDQIKGIATELRGLLGNRTKEMIGNNRYLQNQFYGPTGVTVTMIKDGHKAEVPMRNVEEAKKRGGHIQTPAEYRMGLPSSAPQQ